jgi:hypothetical protein
MIINKLEKNIFYYKNALDDPEKFLKTIEDTDQFCEYYKSLSKWSIWTASTDETQKYGLSKNGRFSKKYFENEKDFDLYRIASTIKCISDFAISFYCDQNKINQPWLPDFFSIKKYSPGIDMGPHVDSNDPTTSNHPVISGVMYLNDNYEGGEIDFVNQKISIKPEAGSIIIFPSYEPYVHHPKKIISGNKYMIPLFWFNKEF